MLISQVDHLNAQYGQLNSQYGQLNSQYGQLSAENAQLRTDVSQQATEIEQLKASKTKGEYYTHIKCTCTKLKSYLDPFLCQS